MQTESEESEEGWEEMIDNEINMMKSISHPNVVSVTKANKQGVYTHRDGKT